MTNLGNAALELRSLLDKHDRSEKHIGYHILPERLNALVEGTPAQNKYVFYELERLKFFLSHVEVKEKIVLDIGCNIGYFLFSFLDAGAKRVVGFEGKKSCADFLNKAIPLLDCQEKFSFFNSYFDFGSSKDRYDVALLLNVLHHLGDDYGDQSLNIESAKRVMLEQLNKLSLNASVLIFQMGFNWKGNRDCCLFANGTKEEMVEYITEGTKDHWRIAHIGVPQRRDGQVCYLPLDDQNIRRDDSLGEFLNRPIFILHSKAR